MNQREERALVKETKALIKEVEAGNTEHAAWVAIQDRVQRLKEDRSQAEVAELLGKGRSWVQQVLRWDAARAASPHGEQARPGMRESTDKAAARKVLADPKTRQEVLENLPDEHIEQVARKALEITDNRLLDRNTARTKPPSAGSKTYDLMRDARAIRNRAADLLAMVQEHGVNDLPEETRLALAERMVWTRDAVALLVEVLQGDDVVSEVEDFLATR